MELIYNAPAEKPDAPKEEKDKKGLAAKIEESFIEKRALYLWTAVDDESMEKLVNKMLYLDNIAPGEPITLYINSPGGSVTSGLILIDTMTMITSPVNTVCMGMAASMGAMILSFGKKKSIYPNARVMIHQPSIRQVSGQAKDMEITAIQIQKTKQKLADMLSENCKQPIDKIMKDFDRDYWMDAEESVAYGIADEIVKSIK
jgi:ATP-dependent Clp protease, protease subunit